MTSTIASTIASTSIQYISLGSNCALTYQLNKLGLRTNSYPFDWYKISLWQLVCVLTNIFNDFSESVKFKKFSLVHNLFDIPSNKILDLDSAIFTNKYNIQFAHEFTVNYELENFKQKFKQRIERFCSVLTNSKTNIFVRIETSSIKSNWEKQIGKIKLGKSNWEKQINILVGLLSGYSKNFKLILIVCECSDKEFVFGPNIHVIKFDTFSPD